MENAAFLLLEDGSVHDGAPPEGLYVKGRRDGERFAPTGDVEGEGLLGEAGQPGWMELSSGTFYGDQTGRPPAPPYLRGYREPSGTFRPASRTVTY